jgi:D-3-phosphoglycerate dehydrogenase
MYKILMTYKSTEGLDALLNNKDFKVECPIDKPTPEQFKELIKGYDGLLIRSEVKVTPEIIEAADKLKFIGRAGTGVDNVDRAAATQKGIVVANVPGGNTISTAEHTIAMMLALSRNIPEAYKALKNKVWKRSNGTELQGKTLGLIGCGRIGFEVAKRMIAFGMKVIAYDPFANIELAKSYGIDIKSLDELYAESDYISIHSPLNDSTRGMINADSIKKMKKGVRLINCARGPIIDEKAVSEAIKAGHIKGAAVDVFAKEPPEDWTLIETDGVVVTPHLAASTNEAQVKIANEMSEVIVDFFTKGLIRNAVNVPAVDWETYKKMMPYTDLAKNIGSFQGQIIDGGIKSVDISYQGSFAEFNTSSLTVSYLQGLLTPILDIKVNFVNTPIVAKERGIKVTENISKDTVKFAGLMTAKIVTDKGEYTMSGTLFDGTSAYIVNINGLSVDVAPKGTKLFITNNDKPGVIGSIGMLLGDNKINIAGMSVGRKQAGSEAVTVVEIDNAPSADIIAKIAKIEGITKVKSVNL